MNKHQHHLLCLWLSLAIFSIATGCAAPGSSLGILKLNCQINNFHPAEEPLKAKVLLPKEYGLGGLDHIFGKPEDYGHSDKVAVKEADLDGNFSFKHEVVYHIAFFLLPPLGAFPKSPPPPVYIIGFSDCRDEVYWVDFKRNKPYYRVYRMPDQVEISADQATWTIFDGSVHKVEIDGRSALDILLKFRRT